MRTILSHVNARSATIIGAKECKIKLAMKVAEQIHTDTGKIKAVMASVAVVPKEGEPRPLTELEAILCLSRMPVVTWALPGHERGAKEGDFYSTLKHSPSMSGRRAAVLYCTFTGHDYPETLGTQDEIEAHLSACGFTFVPDAVPATTTTSA